MLYFGLELSCYPMLFPRWRSWVDKEFENSYLKLFKILTHCKHNCGTDHSKSEPFENWTLKRSVLEWRSVFQVQILSPHCIWNGRALHILKSVQNSTSFTIWYSNTLDFRTPLKATHDHKKCFYPPQTDLNWINKLTKLFKYH